MQSLHRNALLSIALSAVFISGCAVTSDSNKQPESERANSSYSNFLVIGVAGNYNSRAHFERTVVSELRARGSSASAYHTIVKGNKPITREAVRAAIATGDFDAVVVTRVLDADADVKVTSAVTGAKVTRKDGGLLDMFRYDYEEMNEPLALEINTKVTFESTLHSAASEEMVWSFELPDLQSDNIGVLIDEMAVSIVNRLDRDDLIGR